MRRLHAQEQGKAAYNKDAATATVTNRRFGIAEDYTEFRCAKNFRPLGPAEAPGSGGTSTAAGISHKGMHTAAQAAACGAKTPGSSVLTNGAAHAAGEDASACQPAGKKGGGRQRTAVLMAAAGIFAAGVATLTGIGRA